MITPSEADASITSDSLMPPTASWMRLTLTCSWGSLAISSASASSEPATSALTIRLSSACSPIWARAITSSSDTRTPARRAICSVLRRLARSPAIRRASRSLSTTRKCSPASGTPSKPEDLDRRAGRGLLHPLAAVVVHRAGAAGVRAGHQRVAHRQRAAADQDAHHRAAPRVQPRLDHGARRLGGGVGLELLDLGERDHRLQQLARGSGGSWPTRRRTRCRHPSRPG